MTQYSPADDDGPVFSADGFVDPQDQQIEEQDQQMVEQPQGEAQPEEGQQRRRKKNSNTFDKRIKQMAYEKGAIEQNNYFLSQQLAERDAMIAQQQAQLNAAQDQMQFKDELTNSYFENTLDTSQDSIKRALRQAKEEGDIDREIDLTDQLSEVKAKKMAHDMWKIQQQQQQQQRLQEEPYVPYETNVQQPYHAPPVDEDYREWVSENSWYQTNPNLRAEADAVANELANVLTFNNQAQMIGTPEFRDSITGIMRERYGAGSPQQQQDEGYDEPAYNPYQASKPIVAPVTRRVPTMADQYVQNRGPRSGTPLTKDEYMMARYLPIKSKTESETDLINRYKKAKSYPKSPLPGGTPHRLTIL